MFAPGVESHFSTTNDLSLSYTFALGRRVVERFSSGHLDVRLRRARHAMRIGEAASRQVKPEHCSPVLPATV
jgi:hypothetical protein